MRSQEILERAREGDPRVIAAILNYTLRPLGVHVQGARRDRTLHLVLEADPLPDPNRMSTLITKLMQELGGESLEQIVLYGQRVGEEPVAWKQELVLKTETPPSSMTHPESEVTEPVLNQSTPILAEGFTQESLNTPSNPLDPLPDEANPFTLDPSVELLDPPSSENAFDEEIQEPEEAVNPLAAELDSFEEAPELQDQSLNPLSSELTPSEEIQAPEAAEALTTELNLFAEPQEASAETPDPFLSEITSLEELQESEPDATGLSTEEFEELQGSESDVTGLFTEELEELQGTESDATGLFAEESDLFSETPEFPSLSESTLSGSTQEPDSDASFIAELGLLEEPQEGLAEIDAFLPEVTFSETLQEVEPDATGLFVEEFEELQESESDATGLVAEEFEELQESESDATGLFVEEFEELQESESDATGLFAEEFEELQESESDATGLFAEEFEGLQELEPDATGLFAEESDLFVETPEVPSLDASLPESTLSESRHEPGSDESLIAELDLDLFAEPQEASVEIDPLPPEFTFSEETQETEPDAIGLFAEESDPFAETSDSQNESLDTLVSELLPSEGVQNSELDEPFTAELDLVEETLESSADLDSIFSDGLPSEGIQEPESVDTFSADLNFFDETPESQAQSFDALLDGSVPEGTEEPETSDTDPFVADLELFGEPQEPLLEPLDTLMSEATLSEEAQEPESSESIAADFTFFEKTLEPSLESLDVLFSEGLPEADPSASVMGDLDFSEELPEPSVESIGSLYEVSPEGALDEPSSAEVLDQEENLFEETLQPSADPFDGLSLDVTSLEESQDSEATEPSRTELDVSEEILSPTSVETLFSEAMPPEGMPETPPESIETASPAKTPEPLEDLATVTASTPALTLPETEAPDRPVASFASSEGEEDSIKALFQTLKRPEAVILLFALVLVTFWEFYLDLTEGDIGEALTGISLAKRLRVSPSTISRRKQQEDFSAWSQSLDPEGISWIYQEGRFWPLEGSIVSNG